MMGGWKTWSGVATAMIGALAMAAGVQLTPEQIGGILLVAQSLIAVGLGSKADRAKKAAEEAAGRAAAVIGLLPRPGHLK